MEKWILMIGYDLPHFEAARKEWAKHNVRLDSVDTADKAVERFFRQPYIAVIASYRVPNTTPLVDFLSKTNQFPLVILSQNDSGTKFAESIMRGANTFIIDLDNLNESMADNEETIDRLMKIPPHERRAQGILVHRDIVMVVDYYKIFVRRGEVNLSKSDKENAENG